MPTNTEMLTEMKTDIALIKSSLIELTKIIKGNGKTGLVDKAMFHDHEIERIDNTLKTILDAENEEKRKRENTKEKWFWLVIERFVVPIIMSIIMAYIIAPFLK